MRVVIGPVDAGAAREWTEHMLANLEVVRSRRSLLAFALPDEVLDQFRQLLGEWRDAAPAGRYSAKALVVRPGDTGHTDT